MDRLWPHPGRSGDNWIELTLTCAECMRHKTVTEHLKKGAGVGDIEASGIIGTIMMMEHREENRDSGGFGRGISFPATVRQTS